MDFSSEAVPEEELDYEEILRRGGSNHGDEDFALCRCPHCGRVYLLEYEADTLYTDPDDLSQRVSVFPLDFRCVECGGQFPEAGAWIGPQAPPEMQVTWRQLVLSPWRWVTTRTRKGEGGCEGRAV
jgi:hypothetical protein